MINDIFYFLEILWVLVVIGIGVVLIIKDINLK